MRLWITGIVSLMIGACILYGSECKKPLTLQTRGGLSSLEILEELAYKCQFNLIFLDSYAEKILTQRRPRLYVQNLKLKAMLELLFDEANLYFDLQDQVLRVAFLYTQTYELNYVSTSRVGSSSTDVVLSPNSSLQENYDTSEGIAQRAFNLGTKQNVNDSGRSGTKIFSIDENNFWGEIQKEIAQILYRPEDPNSQELQQSITINKHAGLITLSANRAQHKRISQYLKRLKEKMHSQVLIDVHILMIKHSKSHTSGINWNEFYKLGNLAISSPLNGIGGGASFVQIGSSGVNMELNILSQGVTLDRIIEFLESYGETRSMSNPKVLTLNNQPAIISVGSVLRYVQNSIYQSSAQGSNIQNTIETYPSIFAGVLLDVTPSIQGDEIILKINPSITRSKNSSLESEANALKTPPNLSTNQLSSLVRVKSGEKIVLGGLITDVQNKKEFKIPILGDIPILQYLFKYKWNQNFSEEMVIIISPQIISSISQKFSSMRFQQELKQLLREAKSQKNSDAR